jgi:hypothetical protein
MSKETQMMKSEENAAGIRNKSRRRISTIDPPTRPAFFGSPIFLSSFFAWKSERKRRWELAFYSFSFVIFVVFVAEILVPDLESS